MPKHSKLPPLPRRGEIIQCLETVINGECSREDAANWAVKWVISDDSAQDYPILDEEAWELLKLVAAADLKDSPVSYFYGKEDFADWLREIQQ